VHQNCPDLSNVGGVAGGSKTIGATRNNIGDGDGETSSTLDLESLNLMLEPHLRPISPEPSVQLSQEIFNQHKELAQEYLKVSG
jgi:hypothetical protein